MRVYRHCAKHIDFVIFEEDGIWVAHGLQHNVVTHGESLLETYDNIDLLIKAYEDFAPESLTSIPMADMKYWEIFLLSKLS